MVSTQGLLFVFGFIASAIAFIGVVFVLNALLAPKKPHAEKNIAFECGLEPAGQPWAVQNLRFSSLAMLLVLFDAEAVLLFAVATRVRGSIIGLLEVGAFAVFLALGLAYAWRKGALEWRL